MKYEEFQVWYHVFTTAIQARGAIIPNRDELLIDASTIALEAVKVYKTVEKPEVPDMKGLDLKSILENALKNVKR
jgi:hypothetical protein